MSRWRAVLWACVAISVDLSFCRIASAQKTEARKPLPRVAAIVTVYYHNSHADMFVSRILQGLHLDEKEPRPQLNLVSLYVDQPDDPRDTSRQLAARYGFQIYPTIAGALTRGTGKLDVDAVLLIAEHGKYPLSATGQFVFPKRRFFDEMVKVFESSGRRVPVFCDKHLCDNWPDAKAMYDTSHKLKIPLMAGSSLPVTWRRPAVDVPRDAKLKQIVAVSYHLLDTYGFHALETVQCLAEQRAGGETGIAAVRCLTGSAVWQSEADGLYDRALLEAILPRLTYKKIASVDHLRELAREPVLWVIDYRDGLRANVFTLNGAVGDWAVAWNYQDNSRIESTLFWVQDERPLFHFALQIQGIERMFHTGTPAWPVERTLLTSGVLDELLISKTMGGARRETPHLAISYRTDWRWREPPPAPPGRPLGKQ